MIFPNASSNKKTKILVKKKTKFLSQSSDFFHTLAKLLVQ